MTILAYMVVVAPRIEIVSGKLNGKPCIRDTRIPVWMILEWLEAGEQIETIANSFDGITKKDVIAAITFSKMVLSGEINLEIPA